MTFDEYYMRELDMSDAGVEISQGLCDILKKTFEAGQRNCTCVHTDNSAVIAKLHGEIAHLEAEKEDFLENWYCGHPGGCKAQGLKKLVEELKCCGNCRNYGPGYCIHADQEETRKWENFTTCTKTHRCKNWEWEAKQ